MVRGVEWTINVRECAIKLKAKEVHCATVVTYIANMAGKNLTGQLEVTLLLSGKDSLLLIQPAGKLFWHAVAEVFSHDEQDV